MPTPIPISGLTNLSSISDSDITVVVHSGTNYKITAANLTKSSGNSGGDAVFGNGNTLTGTGSSSFGISNTSSTDSSFTAGTSNDISGTSPYKYNTAIGFKNTTTDSTYSTSIGYNNIVSTTRGASVFGYGNTCSASYSFIAGYENEVSGNNGITIGRSNTVTLASNSVVLGFNNTVGNSTKVLSMGTYNTGGYNKNISIGHNNIVGTSFGSSYSMTIGSQNSAYASSSLAIGRNCDAIATNSVAIGVGATSRLYGGINLSGPIIARKDNSEPLYYGLFPLFCGSSTVVLSEEVDLKSTGTSYLYTISGSAFFIEEVGVIITSAASVTVQPFISFSNLLASTQTTGLTTLNDRQKFTTLLTYGGQDSYYIPLAANIDIAATATTMMGRFYWRGFVVESQ